MPTKADYAQARMSGASSKMGRAKSLVATADKTALQAIEEGARAVLKVGPLASEYVQAMGSWSFALVVPLKNGGFFEESVSSDDDEERLRESSEDFDPEYAAHVEPFIKAVEEFAGLHDEYQEIFGRSAAGAPMRFGVQGRVRRDW